MYFQYSVDLVVFSRKCVCKAYRRTCQHHTSKYYWLWYLWTAEKKDKRMALDTEQILNLGCIKYKQKHCSNFQKNIGSRLSVMNVSAMNMYTTQKEIKFELS